MMFDPRTKLVLVMMFAVWVIAASRSIVLTTQLALLVLMIAAIRNMKAYSRWLRLVLPMSIFFGAVTAWSADAPAGVFAGLKLLTLTSAFFVFFAVTLPEDLGNALVQSGLSYPIAFVVSTAMQFVPVIARKAKGIFEAQQARGIPIEPGWAAMRHYPAFFIPLLIQSFQLAEELAEAMEARGFGRSGRTFYKHFRLRWKDWFAMAAGALLTLLMVCL